MKYLFHDCETAGPTSNQSLLTYYGAIVNQYGDTLDEISLQIKPPDGIYVVMPESLVYNKIDLLKHHKTAIPSVQATEQFRVFLRKYSTPEEKLYSAGHNVYWDNGVITKHLLPDFEDFFSRHIVDTAGLAVLLKGTGRLPFDFKISLENLANHYNVKFETQHHDAKSDVKVTISVLKCLLKDLSSRNL